MSELVRVMVVDDSLTYRHILTKAVGSIPNAECISTASSGKGALLKISGVKPDLILLDVVMPGLNGVETLKRIRESHPKVNVVMVSGFDMGNVKVTVNSLALGALDFVTKPQGEGTEQGFQAIIAKLSPLIEMIYAKKGGSTAKTPPTRPARPAYSARKTPAAVHSRNRIRWILIGISTGGPQALAKLLPTLDPLKIPCPILIVQHMPPKFTGFMVENLRKSLKLEIFEGTQGTVPLPGTIYVAPGGYHMRLKKSPLNGDYTLDLGEDAPVQNCRPSVDVLFRSVAEQCNDPILSVVMTGMGRDGTAGVATLKKRKNVYCIAQDEESSVVWGMPASVCDKGLADEVLHLDKIGSRINEYTS